MTRFLAVVVALLTISGCTSLRPGVSASAHLPANAETVALERDERLILPGEFGLLPPPAFPLDVRLRPGTSAIVCLSFVLRFETPEAAARSDDQCTGARRVEPVPVRLAWTFQFRVDRKGRGFVSVTH